MTVSENFVFENPTYVMRVCQEDGRPTMGNQTFIWPKSGPVEDPNFVDDERCGQGLHGCRPNQILSGIMHLTRGDFPIFLICEVEEEEITDLREKCKFPRCNVMYTGTWQGCLTILASLDLEDVPSEEEFLKSSGWETPTKADLNSLNEPLPFPMKSIPTTKWSELQWGDLMNPVTRAERLKVAGYLQTDKKGMTVEQAKEYSEIMRRVDADTRMQLWARLQKNANNLFAVHPYIEQLMVATASSDLHITWSGVERLTNELPFKARNWTPEDRRKARDVLRANKVVMQLKIEAAKMVARKEAIASWAASQIETDFYDWRP